MRIGRMAAVVAAVCLTSACGSDDPMAAGGTGGLGTGGVGASTGGTGGVGGAEVPPFEGFTVAPPPTSGEEFKEKDSHEEKLEALLASAVAPSALAGAFLQLSRAFLSNREAETPLEESAFAILEGVPQETRDAIARTLDAIDAMPASDRNALYVASFVEAEPTAALTANLLASAVATEITARIRPPRFAQSAVDACAEAERPGLPRVTLCPDVDVDFEGFCNAMCRISTPSLAAPIRTSGFVPPLAVDEYLPAEIEQECAIDPMGGPPICSTVTTPDCKGDQGVGDICHAVPTVVPGESVTIQGFSFFDVDAVVDIVSLPPLNVQREVPGHVCGDADADASTDLDCNEIIDLLTFTVPSDLPVGLYRLIIRVPNNTGDPDFDRPFYQSLRGQPVIQVVAPANTEFEITSEEMHCIDETGRLSFGSDEIGIRINTIEVFNDGTVGPLNTVDFDFGNVDSGARRRMDRRHFRGTVGAGVAIAVVGFEIDNRDAFEQSIRTFSDAFQQILVSNWGAISSAVGVAVGGVATIFGGPVVGTAVAAALTFAINTIVAIWAPADLVIEDAAGIAFTGMVELTSQNFPNPPVEERTTPGGVDVLVEPCQDTMELDRRECEASAKASQQYRERREYGSDAERSEYQITLRYNRVN